MEAIRRRPNLENMLCAISHRRLAFARQLISITKNEFHVASKYPMKSLARTLVWLDTPAQWYLLYTGLRKFSKFIL